MINDGCYNFYSKIHRMVLMLALEIKGITVPALLIKLDKGISFEENLNILEEKLSSAFFKDSVVVVDYDDFNISEDQQEQLEKLLKKYNSRVLGYYAKEKSPKKKESKIPDIKVKSALKIINKTLRGGQTVEYDGDVLILGDVNPDAYVIASGNIIVMGALRGVAHAGANGDETATITALKLMPQQLRIAGYISRSPDVMEEPQSPERAYIDNNQIYIEEIK